MYNKDDDGSNSTNDEPLSLYFMAIVYSMIVVYSLFKILPFLITKQKSKKKSKTGSLKDLPNGLRDHQLLTTDIT